MNTKTLTLLCLTVTLAACTAAGPASPAPTRPPSQPPTVGPTAPPTSPPTSSPTNPPASSGASLDGRQFLSVTVTDGGNARPLVPGTVIRLTFQDGSLSANAGCNTIGGTYTVEDGVLVFQGGGMTEMGCPEPRMAQDDWLVAFLGSEPTLTLDGDDLVLTAGPLEITLLDSEVAEPVQPLAGPTWTLTSIIIGDAVSSVPADVVATIQFDENGGVAINPGCNSGGGSYAVDGDEITFRDLITTEMACMGPQMDVEAAVMGVLSADSVTFAIDAGTLTLMAGDNGLQFSAS
jgi:heat shock protein HslJ